MKALIYNSIYGYVGGIERYINKIGTVLKKNGWTLYGLFDRKEGDESDFGDIFEKVMFHDQSNESSIINRINELNVDVVFIHKIENLEILSQLNKNFYTIVTIHDHDYYCFRKHKYFPIKRINCPLPQSQVICSICSLLIQRNAKSKFGFSLLNAKHKVNFMNEIKDADSTVVLSTHMLRNLEMNRWKMDSIYKIYPIHEVSQECTTPKEYKADFIYVGQLIKGKGVDILIDACRQLDFDYTLKIIGTGNDKENLQRMIDIYGLGKKIELIGWVSNVDEYYEQADVVIVPSRWQEPFGLIGIEAFSRCKPVVGFNVGGISEWLHHKKNGYLVKKHNPDSLTKALNYVNDNSSELHEWGMEGNRFVRAKFTEECFMKSLNLILKQAKDKF